MTSHHRHSLEYAPISCLYQVSCHPSRVKRVVCVGLSKSLPLSDACTIAHLGSRAAEGGPRGRQSGSLWTYIYARYGDCARKHVNPGRASRQRKKKRAVRRHGCAWGPTKTWTGEKTPARTQSSGTGPGSRGIRNRNRRDLTTLKPSRAAAV